MTAAEFAGDWYPAFERCVAALTGLVNGAPPWIDQVKLDAIADILSGLSKLEGAQAVERAQQVLETIQEIDRLAAR